MSYLLLRSVVISCKILIFRVLSKYFYIYFADNQLFIFLSCTKFLKFYDTDNIQFLITGSILVLASTLIRQPGIAMGVAFAIIYLLKKRFTFKHLIISLAPIIIALTGLYLYLFWVKITGKVANISDEGILVKNLREAPFNYYWDRFGLVAMYLGLFSLPVSAILLPRLLKKYYWYEYIIILFLGAMTVIPGYRTDFPKGNVFYNLGLGPKLLKDTYWKDNINPLLSDHTMYSIKIISLLSAVIIVIWFSIETLKGIKKFFELRDNPSRLIRATGITFFLIYFAFVMVNPGFFDRYALPCLPFLYIILLPIKPIVIKSNKAIFGILLSLFIIFSITATHDYLSWNRSRWLALDYLTKDLKIEKEKIDGGFEFNAWYQTGPWNPETKYGLSWWCVSSDEYVVSFGNIEGFKAIKRIPYLRLLPPGSDSISILQRKYVVIPDSAFPIVCDCEKKSEDNNLFLSKYANLEFKGGNLQSKSESLSGEYSIQLDSINIYGLLSVYSNLKTNDHYKVSVWKKGSDNKAGIVLAIVPGNKYYNFNTKVIERKSNGWELIESDIIIPENCNGLNLGIYLWNSGKSTVWFDDLIINKFPQ